MSYPNAQGAPQAPQPAPQPQPGAQAQQPPQPDPFQMELTKVISELLASASDIALAYAGLDIDALKKIDGGEDLVEAIRELIKAVRKFQKLVRGTGKGSSKAQ